MFTLFIDTLHQDADDEIQIFAPGQKSSIPKIDTESSTPEIVTNVEVAVPSKNLATLPPPAIPAAKSEIIPEQSVQTALSDGLPLSKSKKDVVDAQLASALNSTSESLLGLSMYTAQSSDASVLADTSKCTLIDKTLSSTANDESSMYHSANESSMVDRTLPDDADFHQAFESKRIICCLCLLSQYL